MNQNNAEKDSTFRNNPQKNNKKDDCESFDLDHEDLPIEKPDFSQSTPVKTQQNLSKNSNFPSLHNSNPNLLNKQENKKKENFSRTQPSSSSLQKNSGQLKNDKMANKIKFIKLRQEPRSVSKQQKPTSTFAELQYSTLSPFDPPSDMEKAQQIGRLSMPKRERKPPPQNDGVSNMQNKPQNKKNKVTPSKNKENSKNKKNNNQQSKSSVESSVIDVDENSEVLITSSKDQKFMIDNHEKGKNEGLPSLSNKKSPYHSRTNSMDSNEQMSQEYYDNISNEYEDEYNQEDHPIAIRGRREVSILDFDPENPERINEPLSIQAMKNLGIKFRDLCYPTRADLREYDSDEYISQMVEDRLRRRCRITIEAVKNERERLSNQIQPDFIERSLHIPAEDTNSKSKNYFAMEQARLDRLEMKNKELAQEKFFAMYMASRNEQKRQEYENEKERGNKDFELYLRNKKNYDDHQHQLLLEKNEKRFNQDQKKRAQTLKIEQERFENYQKMKQQMTADFKERHEEADRRIQRNLAELEKKRERARMAMEEKYHLRWEDRDYDQQKRQELSQGQIQKQQRLREIQQHNKERQEAALANHTKRLAEEKQATIDRLERQDMAQQRYMENKRKELEQKRLDNAERSEEKQAQIRQYQEERQAMKEQKFHDNEERAAIQLQRREMEIEQYKLAKSKLEQMKAEDNQLSNQRREKQRQLILQESDQKYQDKMARLREQEELKKQQEISNEKRRIALEKEKERILTTKQGTNVTSLLGKSESEIKLLAKQMGVDYNMIKERADFYPRIKR